MQSATSSSKRSPNPWWNWVLFRKNVTRFWPIWALYGLTWFFLLVVPRLLELQSSGLDPDFLRRQVLASPLEMLSTAGMISALFYAVVSAMAVFSYLYNARSTGMIHALAIRREGLFFTNYLSGLAFLVVPNVAIFLLALGAQALVGTVGFSSLFTWLVCQSLMCLFFYSFAVFCAMFTGHILALPAFYGILNALVVTIVWLLNSLMREYLFGYLSTDWLFELAAWLTPALKLATGLSVSRATLPSGQNTWVLEGLGLVFLYALAGLVLAGLALAVYRRRQLETAGDVVSVSWVRPIFKYGMAFCSAVSLGTFLYALFGWRTTGIWLLYCFMLLAGAMGYFAAEMLLRKTFRVFRRTWRGWVFFSLALLLLAGGLEFDLFGFERWLPSPAGIQQVEIRSTRSVPYDDGNYAYLTITDPALIEEVVQLHAAILAEKESIENGWNGDYASYAQTVDGSTVYIETQSSNALYVTYLMNSGARIQRSYPTLPIRAEDLESPDTYAARLNTLLNRPVLQKQAYFDNWKPEHRLVSATLYTLDATSYEEQERTLSLDQAQGEFLVEAIQNDISAGRYHRYLLDSEERLTNCSWTDLHLTFYIPGTQEAQPEDGHNIRMDTYTVTITPQATATETLAALKELGFLDNRSLLSQCHTPFPLP